DYRGPRAGKGERRDAVATVEAGDRRDAAVRDDSAAGAAPGVAAAGITHVPVEPVIVEGDIHPVALAAESLGALEDRLERGTPVELESGRGVVEDDISPGEEDALTFHVLADRDPTRVRHDADETTVPQVDIREEGRDRRLVEAGDGVGRERRL